MQKKTRKLIGDLAHAFQRDQHQLLFFLCVQHNRNSPCELIGIDGFSHLIPGVQDQK